MEQLQDFSEFDNKKSTNTRLGKVYQLFAGVNSEFINTNVGNYERRAHRGIGMYMLGLFYIIFLGILLFRFQYSLSLTSLVLGMIFLLIFIVLNRQFLLLNNTVKTRIVKIGNLTFNINIALLFLPFILLAVWLLLTPAILSFQKDDFKESRQLYIKQKLENIDSSFVSDSIKIYKKYDTIAERQNNIETTKRNIQQLNEYFNILTDSSKALSQQLEELQKKSSNDPVNTQKLSHQLYNQQQRMSVLKSQKGQLQNQIQNIEDSIFLIRKTGASFNPYQSEKNSKQEEKRSNQDGAQTKTLLSYYLYKLDKLKKDEIDLQYQYAKLSDSISYSKKDLGANLGLGQQNKKKYNLLSNNQSDVLNKKTDVAVQIQALGDTLQLLSTIEEPDIKLINKYRAHRDSLKRMEAARGSNWTDVYNSVGYMLSTNTSAKNKFTLISLIFLLPCFVLYVYVIFRRNYYRDIYRSFVDYNEKEIRKKSKSIIDFEEVKRSSMDLDEYMKDIPSLQREDIVSETGTEIMTEEDYYFNYSKKLETFSNQVRLNPDTKKTALTEAITRINKAIDLNPARSEFWDLKSRLHFLDGNTRDGQMAAEKFKSIHADELFNKNIGRKIEIDEVVFEGLKFYGSFSWKLNPYINILLGRNGYGKSHFLSILCAILYTDFNKASELSLSNKSSLAERFIKVYLRGDFTIDETQIKLCKNYIAEQQLKIKEENDGEKSSHKIESLKELIKNKRQEIENLEGTIILTPSYQNSLFGKIPILAIPDMRFVNKSSDYTQSVTSDLLKGDEYLKNTAYHFIYQLPYESVLQNLLNIIATIYFDKNRSFDSYFFTIISDVFTDLTGNAFRWHQPIESNQDGTYKIMVLTEGSSEPLAIQKISQGTFSVLSIVGLIYLFLSRKYPHIKDDKILCLQQAIIVIDEIDAHLHPAWQQKIVEILRRNFTECQFIITAHSPLVVAGCKENEVAVMKDERDADNNIKGFSVYQFSQDFIGYSSEELYNRIFEIEGRDEQYFRYTAMQPFVDEMNKEVDELESKKDKAGFTESDSLKLRKLKEDLYYVKKTKSRIDENNIVAALKNENNFLKNELVKLNKTNL